ncbi:ionotropic receptor 21a [Orussus abietinus]|uniref:ionotropic receptor 21a n=1 Tax=Orussus abietinus TaxID=222816 RepID=UPI0006264123|nr:ionotropic receptor 21a [Orussus abietinus]
MSFSILTGLSLSTQSRLVPHHLTFLIHPQPGSYVLFTHNLYSNGIGSSEPVLLTSWIRDRFTRDVDLFPEKLLLGFQGHRLAISTAHTPPFAIRRSISGTDEVLWDGIDIRVMHLLAKILNFTIEFRDPESVENGPITSATKDVALGVASVGVGGIYKTRDVVSQFDTTVSHVEDCAAFISLASMALPKYRAVMGPFSVTVWILLICAYLLAILPFSLNTEYSLLSLITRPSTTNNMFWFVFSTFTNSFKVKDPLLKHGLGKNSTSLLIGIYWVFTIIITSCYTGSIIAFITVPIYPDAMETTKELLWYRYRIGTLDHDGWDARLAEIEDDPIAEKLLKNVEFVPSVTAGVRNASRAFFWPYAFLGSRTLFEYIVQANFTPNWFTKRSLMHISRECFSTYGTTFLLPHRSIYTESFNKMLARAQQTGIIQKIIRDVKWDIQRTATGKFLQVSKGPSFPFLLGEERQLTLDDTQGMFMIFGIGVLAGMILLIMEFIIRKIDKYCRRENIDDCQEIQDDDQPEYVNKFRMSMLRTSEDDVSMMWRFWKSRASV